MAEKIPAGFHEIPGESLVARRIRLWEFKKALKDASQKPGRLNRKNLCKILSPQEVSQKIDRIMRILNLHDIAIKKTGKRVKRILYLESPEI